MISDAELWQGVSFGKGVHSFFLDRVWSAEPLAAPLPAALGRGKANSAGGIRIFRMSGQTRSLKRALQGGRGPSPGPAVGTHPHGTAGRPGSDGELWGGAVHLGGDVKQRSLCAGALPLKQSRGREQGGGGGGRGARRLGSAAAAAGGGRRRGGERSPAGAASPGVCG